MRGFIAGAVSGLAVVLTVVALIGPPTGTRPAIADTAAPPQTQAAAAGPELTPKALRAMIHADDIAGVEAALTGLPLDSKDDQIFTRSVYSMFGERHPAMLAFTDHWLQERPDSPMAMTARGWALHAEGWAMRGDGYYQDISAPALQAFKAAHQQGLALMQAALQSDPAFLPASDGVLAMAYPLGQQDLIEPEVARIMALRPNRWTLTLAGQALAPNWGGSEDRMKTLCRDYAPLVTDWPGYDPEVCFIDGQMKAGYLRGAEFEALAEKIRTSDNPALAGWNPQTGAVPGQTPTDRLTYLDEVKQTRDLSYDEARVYDQDAAQVAILAGEPRAPEFPAALTREVEKARARADAQPGDWQAVARFLNIAAEDRQVNGTKADMDELWQRQVGALRLSPYDARIWSSVGMTVFGRQAPEGEVEAMAAAEPYLVNAAVYSNHASDSLVDLVSPKLSLMVRSMSDGSLPVSKEQWQSQVQCPLVRQMRLLIAACEADGRGFGECSGLPYAAKNMQDLIRDIQAAGACEAEATDPLETLAYSAIAVDLPQD